MRFRTTNNDLPVNRLRYIEVPREERICDKCDLQLVADEYHYILICPFFNNFRADCFKDFTIARPAPFIISNIFTSNNKQLLMRLKHFICQINNVFK